MYIDSLVIETTRRCNMQCKHCCRGPAEDIDMQRSDMVNLFTALLNTCEETGEELREGRAPITIGTIIFSGGEPSLAPHVIGWCLDVMKSMRVEYENFYIATNGKVASDEFIKVILELWCGATDNGVSSVDLSNTEYHGYKAPRLVTKLDAFKFFGKKYKDTPPEHAPIQIFNEGHALINKLGNREVCHELFSLEGIGNDSYFDEARIVDGTLYYNCFGELFSSCNLSYSSMRCWAAERAEFFLCDLRENVDINLIEILEKYNGNEDYHGKCK